MGFNSGFKGLNHHRGDLSMYCNTVKNRNLLLFRARWAVSKADPYYSGDRLFDYRILRGIQWVISVYRRFLKNAKGKY